MKKSKLLRTLTLAVAAALCMATTTVTAYAGGADPDPVPLPETTEAPAEVPEETEEPTTGGMEPEGIPVTPEGNATLVDDFYGDKQLITVTTKAGNYFYILIDRANEDKETAVHFLNQVDDADLQALLEDGKAAPETCTCTTKCAAGAVNTNCPVCKTNMTECTGPEPEPQEPEETEQPQEDEAKGSGMGGLVVFLVVALIGGGAALYFFKFKKPKADTKGGDELVSRLGVRRKADLLVPPEVDVFEAVRTASRQQKLACVLCDESQFFTPNQAAQLFMVTVDLNIPVICYGLRSDFSLKGFPGSTRLLELAHTIEEMKTICTCGRKATCNCRKVNGQFVFEGEQVAIDQENDVQYVSMCPQCYFRERSAFYAARR